MRTLTSGSVSLAVEIARDLQPRARSCGRSAGTICIRPIALACDTIVGVERRLLRDQRRHQIRIEPRGRRVLLNQIPVGHREQHLQHIGGRSSPAGRRGTAGYARLMRVDASPQIALARVDVARASPAAPACRHRFFCAHCTSVSASSYSAVRDEARIRSADGTPLAGAPATAGTASLRRRGVTDAAAIVIGSTCREP